MLCYLFILSLALWKGSSASLGGEMLQLNIGQDMISLTDAVSKNVLLPDTVANFSQWIDANDPLQPLGLYPRQRQCVDAGYCKAQRLNPIRDQPLTVHQIHAQTG